MDIPLRCACGSMRGTARLITPTKGNRVVCLCDDCQAYAHYLGGAESILDKNGGTDIFQITPSQLTLTKGTNHLGCVRLSPNGLMRWYATCCKTPLANTLSSTRIPFAGVVHTCMDHSAGPPREQALGPVLAQIQGKFARHGLPDGAHSRMPVRLILRALRHMASGFFRGAHKPSPFYSSDFSKPLVPPTVVQAAEREKLRALCGPKRT